MVCNWNTSVVTFYIRCWSRFVVLIPVSRVHIQIFHFSPTFVTSIQVTFYGLKSGSWIKSKLPAGQKLLDPTHVLFLSPSRNVFCRSVLRILILIIVLPVLFYRLFFFKWIIDKSKQRIPIWNSFTSVVIYVNKSMVREDQIPNSHCSIKRIKCICTSLFEKADVHFYRMAAWYGSSWEKDSSRVRQGILMKSNIHKRLK